MGGCTELLYLRRTIQRKNFDLVKITGSKTCIGTLGNMANAPRFVSKGICNNTINLHGVGSQNDPVHNHRIMTAFRILFNWTIALCRLTPWNAVFIDLGKVGSLVYGSYTKRGQATFLIARLLRCLLGSEGFAKAADFVAADRGRKIAPAAADKAEHIRHFRIAQAPPEVRHGQRGRRSLSGRHG